MGDKLKKIVLASCSKEKVIKTLNGTKIINRILDEITTNIKREKLDFGGEEYYVSACSYWFFIVGGNAHKETDFMINIQKDKIEVRQTGVFIEYNINLKTKKLYLTLFKSLLV